MGSGLIPLASYSQAIRNNRILAIVIIALSFLLLAAVGAFFMILPLKTVELKVIEYQRDKDVFVKVYSPSRDFKSKDIVQALFLRQYVEARESIDKITEPERLSVIYKYSAPSIWKQFVSANDKRGSAYLAKGLKREIKITRDSKLSNHVHQIEYKTIDTKDGVNDENGVSKKVIKEWVVTLEYTNHDQLVDYSDRYANPLGTIVNEYSYAKRNKGSNE